MAPACVGGGGGLNTSGRDISNIRQLFRENPLSMKLYTCKLITSAKARPACNARIDEKKNHKYIHHMLSFFFTGRHLRQFLARARSNGSESLCPIVPPLLRQGETSSVPSIPSLRRATLNGLSIELESFTRQTSIFTWCSKGNQLFAMWRHCI